MAIKKYLIANDPYQKRDNFGNPVGKIGALVTQGKDTRFTPVPARVSSNWWFSNDLGNTPSNTPCPNYIKALDGKYKGLVVPLASTPESFSNQTEQSVSSESPIGSLQPVITFGSTGARTLTFQFSVFGDYLPKLNGGIGLANYNVVSYCKLLQQLALPTQSGNGKDVAYSITPPIVEFYYGGIHILGIFKCNTDFGSTITNGVIDRATVSISITETEKIINGEVYI